MICRASATDQLRLSWDTQRETERSLEAAQTHRTGPLGCHPRCPEHDRDARQARRRDRGPSRSGCQRFACEQQMAGHRRGYTKMPSLMPNPFGVVAYHRFGGLHLAHCWHARLTGASSREKPLAPSKRDRAHSRLTTVGDGSMSDADGLRERAQRCLRLARSINNPDAIATLEAMGRELEARALEIERHEQAASNRPQLVTQPDSC
jgi:hypothetical protein